MMARMSLCFFLLIALLNVCFLHVHAEEKYTVPVKDTKPTDEVKKMVLKVQRSTRTLIKKCHDTSIQNFTPISYTMEENEKAKRYYVKFEEKVGAKSPVVKITFQNGRTTFSGVSIQGADVNICYKKYAGCPYKVTC